MNGSVYCVNSSSDSVHSYRQERISPVQFAVITPTAEAVKHLGLGVWFNVRTKIFSSDLHINK
jgi:hypothetical protein